jgi:hypothetical protein
VEIKDLIRRMLAGEDPRTVLPGLPSGFITYFINFAAAYAKVADEGKKKVFEHVVSLFVPVAAIATREPSPIPAEAEVPEDLARFFTDGLRADRPQKTAAEVLARLEGLPPSPRAGRLVKLLLPFLAFLSLAVGVAAWYYFLSHPVSSLPGDLLPSGIVSGSGLLWAMAAMAAAYFSRRPAAVRIGFLRIGGQQTGLGVTFRLNLREGLLTASWKDKYNVEKSVSVEYKDNTIISLGRASSDAIQVKEDQVQPRHLMLAFVDGTVRALSLGETWARLPESERLFRLERSRMTDFMRSVLPVKDLRISVEGDVLAYAEKVMKGLGYADRYRLQVGTLPENRVDISFVLRKDRVLLEIRGASFNLPLETPSEAVLALLPYVPDPERPSRPGETPLFGALWERFAPASLRNSPAARALFDSLEDLPFLLVPAALAAWAASHWLEGPSLAAFASASVAAAYFLFFRPAHGSTGLVRRLFKAEVAARRAPSFRAFGWRHLAAHAAALALFFSGHEGWGAAVAFLGFLQHFAHDRRAFLEKALPQTGSLRLEDLFPRADGPAGAVAAPLLAAGTVDGRLILNGTELLSSEDSLGKAALAFTLRSALAGEGLSRVDVLAGPGAGDLSQLDRLVPGWRADARVHVWTARAHPGILAGEGSNGARALSARGVREVLGLPARRPFSILSVREDAVALDDGGWARVLGLAPLVRVLESLWQKLQAERHSSTSA